MRLKPTKSVALGDITSFVIKGCSLILSPALKHVFFFILAYYCSIFHHRGSSGHCSYTQERQQHPSWQL
jgi:hypothetical protein